MEKKVDCFVTGNQIEKITNHRNTVKKERTLNNLELLNSNPLSRQEQRLKTQFWPDPVLLARGFWNWSSDKSDLCIVISLTISSASLFSAPRYGLRTISSHFVVQDLWIKTYKNKRPLLDSPEYKTNRPPNYGQSEKIMAKMSKNSENGSKLTSRSGDRGEVIRNEKGRQAWEQTRLECSRLQQNKVSKSLLLPRGLRSG